jgi:hypothetical protein
MAASVNNPRINQIARCMDELHACAIARRTPNGWDLALYDVWELDWLSELHRLLYEEK